MNSPGTLGNHSLSLRWGGVGKEDFRLESVYGKSHDLGLVHPLKAGDITGTECIPKTQSGNRLIQTLNRSSNCLRPSMSNSMNIPNSGIDISFSGNPGTN